MDLYKNIKMLRKANKMSQEDLAKRAGYTDRSSIAKIENGEVDLGQSKILIFANIFGISPSDLMGELPNVKKVGVTIPLYGALCCGNGCFVDDNIIDQISLPPEILSTCKDYFAQYASGDSMTGANINDGDILVFEKTSSIQNGQIGCFCIDDNEAMCKRYKVTADNQVILMPCNDNYDPITINPMNEHFRCVGKLSFVINDRRDG